MIAIVGAGSNLGGRWSLLRCARAVLRARGVSVEACSPTYTTPALVPPGDPPGPEFLNEAWRVRWDGSAETLLRRLLQVEALLGRVRKQRWDARTLDLDVLWTPRPVRSPILTVPHPELLRRSFALAPLLDVAPELAPVYARYLRQRPRRGGGPTALETRLARTHRGAEARIVRRVRGRADELPALLAQSGLAIGATAVLAADDEVELVVAGTPRRRRRSHENRRK